MIDSELAKMLDPTTTALCARVSLLVCVFWTPHQWQVARKMELFPELMKQHGWLVDTSLLGSCSSGNTPMNCRICEMPLRIVDPSPAFRPGWRTQDCLDT